MHHAHLPRRRSAILVIATLVAAWCWSPLHAQSDSSRTLLKPTFSLGAGMFSFYGDVGAQNKGYSPLVARVGYELRASTPVTDWLEVSLFALHGRLGGNERSITRNINFESRITTGGVLLTYNFAQLLPPKHSIEPYISLGFESVEFLSKTDLYDAQGRRYNYWTDGTIRDLPEHAPNAGSAVVIDRDYTYESDVRESNLDGFGKYLERTWAIPVGVGVKMCLEGGFDVRFGTTMHFSRTDLIDGITADSKGDRQGDSKMDRFMYSGVSVGYAIDLNHAKRKKLKEPTLTPEQMDALALMDDEDGDGVTDWNDLCPHTPAGTAVTTSGCPLDGDGDGVPDHMDDEPNTLAGAPVNARGVTLSDDDILQAWLNYKDSANVNIVTSRAESFGPMGKPTTRRASANRRQYVVKVGSQVEGISEDMIQKILSLPDVRTIEQGDTTFYVVGKYSDLPEALRRQLGLEEQGFSGEVMVEENGRLHDLSAGDKAGKGGQAGKGADGGAPNGSNGQGGTDGGGNGTDAASQGKTLVRVQLGAFRNPPSNEIFKGIDDLVKIKGDDGVTRFYTGSYTDVNEAARHKVDMLLKGFNGAFLVAFKNGKRVSLKEAGAQLTFPEDRAPLPTSGVDKSKLRFRIQVGTFAGNVPVDMMGKYLELGDVMAVPTASSVRYLYGSFTTRAEAEQARKELAAKGFGDSFLVGDLDGRIITVDDAQRLLSEP